METNIQKCRASILAMVQKCFILFHSKSSSIFVAIPPSRQAIHLDGLEGVVKSEPLLQQQLSWLFRMLDTTSSGSITLRQIVTLTRRCKKHMH